jgi:MoaA/NifB/PqqE/SkfB family radical SAM enzyme
LKVLEGAFISVASGFEPLMYRNFDTLMRGLTDLGLRMQIITNGTLLDREKLQTLLASNMEIINFSFDGIRKQTFEHIRRGAYYEETLDNILAAREAFRGRETAFFVNSTTMRRNLLESVEIVDFWNRHGFDVVRFLPMVVRYADPELIRESLYPIRNQMKKVFEECTAHLIENRLRIVMLLPYWWNSELRQRFPTNFDGIYVQSDNPASRKSLSLREQFQLGEHPLMRFYDCRAPFTSATILANGDVQLCYKFSVGNLHERPFEDIWFGEEADRIRRRITGAPKECDACDCFRFGIAFHRLDADRIENYFAGELRPYLKYVDFERGLVDAQVAPKPPRLVCSEREYNVVFYADQYFAIPQSTGPFEVDKTDLSTNPNVLIENTYAGLIARIHRMYDESPGTEEVVQN